MTFPNFPKRSSSEDDALDQALNAWAIERHSELAEESPREALSNDALEFHRWADEALRTEPAAMGPAASTWNRVLRNTAQATNKGGDMSSAALSTEPQSAIIQDVRPWNREQISRYLNNTAMLVIVFGVAFAGALTAMQLNQPGGSDGQFGLFGQSDQAAMCDVEPLSVDRVMEIVKNPFPFMENGPAGEPVYPENAGDLLNLEYFEADDLGVKVTLHGSGESPNEEQFGTASEFANAYLQCLVHGTRGQVWTFYSPADIQKDILNEFQVFADESDVRSYVEERIMLPAYQYDEVWNGYDRMWSRAIDAYQPVSAFGNPDPGVALFKQDSASHFEFIITMGVALEDADGQQVYLTSATGNELVRSREVSSYNIIVNVGKHRFYDQWYILPESSWQF